MLTSEDNKKLTEDFLKDALDIISTSFKDRHNNISLEKRKEKYWSIRYQIKWAREYKKRLENWVYEDSFCGVYPTICNHQGGHSGKYCKLLANCEHKVTRVKP
jgi:hypothetical protein